MAEGTLKWFNPETGYGLISPENGRRKLFVSPMNIAPSTGLESLQKGDEVTYEVAQDRNGMRATKVSRKPSYSWRDDSLERHEGKEARHGYYEGL